MEKKFFILENGAVSQAYSIDDLRTKDLTSSTLVCVKFGDWKAAKDIPEIAEILEWHPKSPSEVNWSPSPPPINTTTQQQFHQPVQPIQQPAHQTIVIAGLNRKSTGLAFVLAFFFGPLGLLYASVLGGIVMFFVSLFIGIITFGFGLIISWIICVIWAMVAVNNHNEKLSQAPLAANQYRQTKQLTNNHPVNTRTNEQKVTNVEIPIIKESVQKENISTQNSELKVADLSNKEAITQQSKPQIGKISPKSTNAFGDWMTTNKKKLYIGSGSIFGLVILFVAANFILGIQSNNDNSSHQFIEQNSISSMNEVSMTKNEFIIDTYLGTIGNKDFKLFIENVDGENVEGFNVTGTNRRPVKGKIVNKWTKPTGFGGEYTIFKLILNEPGDDKWDGEFNIDLWISDIGRHGEGNWKSFNGQLNRKISIIDRHNE